MLLMNGAIPAIAQTPVLTPGNSYPSELSNVQVADLNSDNAPDIVGLASGGGSLGVLRNLGNGTYAPARYYSVSGQLNGVAVGDFNGDGKLDVAVAIGAYNASSGKVAVLLNAGDGTLKAPTYYTVATPANSIAVADLNNDNRPDIAVIGNNSDNTKNTVVLLTNTGSTFTQKSFPAPVYFTPNGFGDGADFVLDLVAGDFNGDGRIDLAYIDGCAQCSVSEEELFILANTTADGRPSSLWAEPAVRASRLRIWTAMASRT